MYLVGSAKVSGDNPPASASGWKGLANLEHGEMNKTWTLPRESRKNQPSISCVHVLNNIPMHGENAKEKEMKCDVIHKTYLLLYA